MIRGLAVAASILLALPSLGYADESQCSAAAGDYLTGTVQTGPEFKGGKKLKGVYLSHTHLSVKADKDGQIYDVAIDNVFADHYRRNEHRVPAPLDAIRIGDRLELCGQFYTGGDVGIHWVHTNCGAPPTHEKPNGWVRRINGDQVGDNMEDNQKYCYLWQ